MSYAEAAASGPPQSAEEARAQPVPEIIPTESSVESLVDVDSGVTVVPSDFEEQDIKTETQAIRLDLEAEAAEEAEEARQREIEEGEKKLKEAAPKPKKEQKEKAKKAASTVKSYAEIPVVALNGVIGALAAVSLGYGAYRKHSAGQLSWKMVGLWSAGVAAVAGADFAISTWLYQNYPPAAGKKDDDDE
ncbi:hypothetical protein EDC01DRAFT_633961 [Geopyxis carbonaria]|nr:hypothetical protein EDC01DRAFT_633961 [Geopyxis carbonaria]